MKTNRTLSIAAAAFLLAALMWAAPASARWDYSDSEDSALSNSPSDAIGTGSMSDTESSEPAVNTDESIVSSPDISSEGVEPGLNSPQGTGSMSPENNNLYDIGFSGQSGVTRPDVDLP